MIHNKTARQLMYDWHSGQWSPFYAAASSGLVEDWERLIGEAKTINNKDGEKLVQWLEYQKAKPKAVSVLVRGVLYGVLPWVS